MKETLELISNHIINGQGAEARRLIKQVLESKIPRDHKVILANLARRANLHALAVQLLNPIVRPKGKKLSDATDAEKAEYAASLSYLGASEEALLLLKQVDSSKVPQALLFEAFACFAQWNYADAIPLLEKYIQAKQITEYQKLVGKVNLAAALVYERKHEPAGKLLNELLSATSAGTSKLLHGNTLELAAQNAIHQKSWKLAEKYLNESDHMLGNTESDEHFFVRKWKAVLNFLKKPGDEKKLSELREIRKEAITLEHWETVRDCDRFESIYRRDLRLFTYLYYGSPYESFRTKALKESGLDIPSTYLWSLKRGKNAHRIDLLTGEENYKGNQLKVGQALHRLLVILSSDFYKPTRVAVIHAKLFPGEFFNPLTSPPKVYEIVRRLRAWLEESKIPLLIKESKGFYHLEATAPVSIQISRSEATGNRENTLTQILQKNWPESAFSTTEAAQALKVSARSSSRLIKELETQGKLVRQGSGPSTKFHFKKAA